MMINQTNQTDTEYTPLPRGLLPGAYEDLQKAYAYAATQKSGPYREAGFAEDGAFGLADTLMAVPRGIAGFGSDVVNLALLPFGTEVENRFGMSGSRTGVGQITEGLTNFLTGFIPGFGIAGKIGSTAAFARTASGVAKATDAAYTASRAAYRAGNLSRAAALGAKGRAISLVPEFAKATTVSAVVDFIGFDGHEARLSNFLRDYAGLQDPITEFLAASMDDSEITGRLKNAIEGAFIGGVADALFASVRVFRAGQKAKAGGLDPTRAMIEESARIRGEHVRAIMDATGASEEQAAAALTFIEMSGVSMSDLSIVQEASAAVRRATTVGAPGELPRPTPLIRPEAVGRRGIGALGRVPRERVARTVVRNPELGPETADLRTTVTNEGLSGDVGAARGVDQPLVTANLAPIVDERRIIGFVEFAEDGRVIVGLMQGADVDTVVHEGSHLFRRYLLNKTVDPQYRLGISNDDIDLISEWAGARLDTDSGDWIWDRVAEERFADALMNFLRTNQMPDQVNSEYIWTRIAAWLTDVYENVRQTPELTIDPKLAKAFDRVTRNRLETIRAARRDAEIKLAPKTGRAAAGGTRAAPEYEQVPAGASSSARQGDPTDVLFSLRPEDGYPLTKQPNMGLLGPLQGATKYSANVDEDALLEVNFNPYSDAVRDAGLRVSRPDGSASGTPIPVFELSFTVGGSMRNQGKGAESIKTLSTVANAFRQFVKEFQETTGELPTITYSAETGRARVYTRMLHRLGEEMGYDTTGLIDDVLSTPKRELKGMFGNNEFREVLTPPGTKAEDITDRLDDLGFASMPAPRRSDADGDVLFQMGPAGGSGPTRITLTGGAPITPGSRTGARPAGRGSDFSEINVDRFSSVGEVNRYVQRFVRTVGATSPLAAAPEDLATIAARAEGDANALGAMLGNYGAVSFRPEDLGLRTGLVPEAARNLQALRQLASSMMKRVSDLAKKGSAANEADVYEWLRGRLIGESMLRSIKSEARAAARMLGQQRIVPVPDDALRITRNLKELGDETLAIPPKAPEVIPDQARFGSSPETPTARQPGEADPGAAGRPPETAAETNAAAASTSTSATGTTRKPFGGEATPAMMKELIDEHGGLDHLRRLMDKMKRAQEAAGEEGVAKILRGSKTKFNKGMNTLVEYWMNSILSGPITQTVNLASTMMATMYLPFERALGAAMRGNMPLMMDSLRSVIHLGQELPEALRFAKAAFLRGESILDGVQNATELRRGPGTPRQAVSAEGYGLEPNTTVGGMIDFIGNLINLPSRLLTTSDEVFKQMNYRSQFRGGLMQKAVEMFPDDQAARAQWVSETMEKTIGDGQAYAEMTLVRRAQAEAESMIAKGTLKPEAKDEYIEKLLAKESLWSEELGALSQTSLARAREATFQTRLDPRGSTGEIRKFSARVQSVVSTWPFLRFLVPFVRTPTNLLVFALERAPVSSQFINTRKAFSKAIGDSLSSDAAMKADAMGRLAFGTAAAGTLIMLADSEMITGGGPQNRAEREAKMQTGWMPYSIKVGDKYMSYRRGDPFSTIAGVCADLVECLKAGGNIEGAGDMFDLLTTSVVTTISRNITNKTYLVGLTGFMNAVSEPERYGEQLVEQYVGGFVPNVLNQSQDLFQDDDVMREARGAVDSLRSRIPGLSVTLPPRRNILGEPITKNKRLGFLWSPVEYTEINDDVIFKELELIGHGFSRPRTTKGSVDLTMFNTQDGQQAYDRWLELHGDVKLGGLTLRDRLSRTIRSQSYQRLDAAGDEEFDSPRTRTLRGVISRYREAAWNQLLKESPELRDAWGNDQRIRRGLRTGKSMDQLMALDRSR